MRWKEVYLYGPRGPFNVTVRATRERSKGQAKRGPERIKGTFVSTKGVYGKFKLTFNP